MPFLRPLNEISEARRDGILVVRPLCEPAASLRQTIPITLVVDIRQPQNNRPQATLTLGRAMACNSMARGCFGVHPLHVK
jgi:hypothetical protein